MPTVKKPDDFSSFEEKQKYARSALRSLSSLSCCETGCKVIEAFNLSEKDCDSLINSFGLVQAILEERNKVQLNKEYAALRAKAESGFVYLIHLFDDCYKIGKSTNPQNRLQQIISIAKNLKEVDVFEGVDPVLVTFFPTLDMAWAETYMHAKYDNFRDSSLRKYSYGLTTELFRLTPDHVEEFKRTDRFDPDWFSQDLAERSS